MNIDINPIPVYHLLFSSFPRFSAPSHLVRLYLKRIIFPHLDNIFTNTTSSIFQTAHLFLPSNDLPSLFQLFPVMFVTKQVNGTHLLFTEKPLMDHQP